MLTHFILQLFTIPPTSLHDVWEIALLAAHAQTRLASYGRPIADSVPNGQTRAPHSWSPVLDRVRYRVETVYVQLVERCDAKRVWARDLLHQRNRLLRMILMHTVSVFFNLQADCYQFE